MKGCFGKKDELLRVRARLSLINQQRFALASLIAPSEISLGEKVREAEPAIKRGNLGSDAHT